jgi:hypothetical protein
VVGGGGCGVVVLGAGGVAVVGGGVVVVGVVAGASSVSPTSVVWSGSACASTGSATAGSCVAGMTRFQPTTMRLGSVSRLPSGWMRSQLASKSSGYRVGSPRYWSAIEDNVSPRCTTCTTSVASVVSIGDWGVGRCCALGRRSCQPGTISSGLVHDRPSGWGSPRLIS